MTSCAAKGAMRNANSAIAAALAGVLLSGCGVISGSIKISTDKEFPFSEITKVTPGMKESEVISLLGKPTAFGMNDKARYYLKYQQTTTATRTTMLTGPGIGTLTQKQAAHGFEVEIYLKDGVVETIGHTLYSNSRNEAK